MGFNLTNDRDHGGFEQRNSMDFRGKSEDSGSEFDSRTWVFRCI